MPCISPDAHDTLSTPKKSHSIGGLTLLPSDCTNNRFHHYQVSTDTNTNFCATRSVCYNHILHICAWCTYVLHTTQCIYVLYMCYTVHTCAQCIYVPRGSQCTCVHGACTVHIYAWCTCAVCCIVCMHDGCMCMVHTCVVSCMVHVRAQCCMYTVYTTWMIEH